MTKKKAMREASTDLYTQVVEEVASVLLVDASEITSDAKLQEDLGADSMDLVELVMVLEDRFDIEIPDAKAEKAHMVKQLVDTVKELLNERGGKGRPATSASSDGDSDDSTDDPSSGNDGGGEPEAESSAAGTTDAGTTGPDRGVSEG
jgi:acyl carrier protein